MVDFEKLGVFYLGQTLDPASLKPTDDLLLYNSKDLTTHALCIGMTGSGKTGVSIAMLEEAAIDKIPVIAIDPKGDLANLLLQFPKLSQADFLPWVDEGEAQRQSLSREQFADKKAKEWAQGLEASGQNGDRIQKLLDTVDLNIYTPGSNQGLQLALLKSFSCPDKSEDAAEKVEVAVSSLLDLMGVPCESGSEPEFILLCQIIMHQWQNGENIQLSDLVALIKTPPFSQVGALDLESFFNEKDRQKLAVKLNGLLASPKAKQWMTGAPLNIDELLYNKQSKPCVSILSIAHLDDAERMYFVTQFLNELVTWMRKQSGTSSLRAIMFMDEIFGYFPSTANPPSKRPMLTLLKQARSQGVGLFLATQNPVDLDYKGLSNIGTWIVGRLQTERDRKKILDGLQGVLEKQGISANDMDKMLSSLEPRMFLLNNVHQNQTLMFKSRWTMSFLRGPITGVEIAQLTSRKKQVSNTPQEVEKKQKQDVVVPNTVGGSYFVLDSKKPVCCHVLAESQVHYVDKAKNIDVWLDGNYLIPVNQKGELQLALGEQKIETLPELVDKADNPIEFIPQVSSWDKAKDQWQDEVQDEIYKTQKLNLFSCTQAKVPGQAGETEAAYRTRLSHFLREQKDEQIELIKKKYQRRIEMLEGRVTKAQEKVDREKQQVQGQTISTAVSLGATLLGAFLGNKKMSVGNISRAATTLTKATKIAKESGDVKRAALGVDATQTELESLQAELDGELVKIEDAFDPALIKLETVQISPKKTEIKVKKISVVWSNS